MLGAKHGQEPDALLRRAALGGAAASAWADAAGAAATRPDGGLCGTYACYSHAQSPCWRGRPIGGALAVTPAARRADGLVGTYSHALAVGRAQASGPAGPYGRALCLELRVPSSGMAPLSCSLFRPSPPASVLAGVMCGTTAVHPGGQPPCATRIVMARVPAVSAAGLEAPIRYLDPSEGPPSRDLAALGLPIPDAPGLDARIARFVRLESGSAGSDQASIADHAALAIAWDRPWLDGGTPREEREPAPGGNAPGARDPSATGGAPTPASGRAARLDRGA